MPIDFFLHGDMNDLVRQARQDLASWDTYAFSHNVFTTSPLANLPKSQQLLLKQDPDATLKLLSDPAPHMRLAALFLVYDYWISHSAFTSSCLHLAFHDPQSEVRGLAILCLGRLQDFIIDSRGQLRSLLQMVLPEDDETLTDLYQECQTQIIEGMECSLKWMQDRWRKIAGDLLDDMLKSPDKSEHYLDHSNQELRCVALEILTLHWEPTARAADSALQIAKDCSLLVQLRKAAVILLGKYYQQSNNKAIGSLFASIVANETEDTSLRYHSYEQLHHLRGIPSQGLPEWSKKDTFPAGVDWNFVSSFKDELFG